MSQLTVIFVFSWLWLLTFMYKIGRLKQFIYKPVSYDYGYGYVHVILFEVDVHNNPTIRHKIVEIRSQYMGHQVLCFQGTNVFSVSHMNLLYNNSL